MNKKSIALCSIIVAFSICVAVFGVTGEVKSNVTSATLKNYYAPKSESTTNDVLDDVLSGIGSGSEGIGDILGGMDSSGLEDAVGGIGDSFGGIGDALGGVGDMLGGIAGGLGDSLGGILGGGSGSVPTLVNTTAPVSTSSADIGLIIPVPAATQTPSETETTAVESSVEGETVDFSATSNPYKKPAGTFVAGDEDETIKWLQWIFIYSGYGLKDDGITGVLDEDTVAVIKKLQHENKMSVDGNITEDVIKAAEILYYQSILGEDVSAIEISSDATTSVKSSDQADSTEGETEVPVALLVIILVIIWVLAIGGIVLLFVFKKKKSNANKQGEAKPDNTASKTNIGSLSDLFEEAEKNKK